MRVLALDTESTTSNKGNPFDRTNRSVCWSAASPGKPADAVRTDDASLVELQRRIDDADLLILFNAKFDLHWLRRLGIKFEGKRVHCCQLAEYILSRQTWAYPSLEDTAVKYGLGNKRDAVKEDYWKKGIDTDQIPWEILSDYAAQDAALTLAIYYKQMEQLSGKLLRLFALHMYDLLVLQEMEWQGMVYDEDKCVELEGKLSDQVSEIKAKLTNIYPDVPINFGSGPQLSAFLYGGTISVDCKVHDGFFKTGKRAGEPKYKNVVKEYTLPQMYKPIGDPLASGAYSTAEDTLKKLKGNKKVVEMLLELAKLDKLLGTYYRGYPKLNREMNWPPGILHGQYNQVKARTGRLSSTKPNLQNIAGDVQYVFTSRFP